MALLAGLVVAWVAFLGWLALVAPSLLIVVLAVVILGIVTVAYAAT